MNSVSVEQQKKKYAAPKLNDLTVEQAKEFLLDQAARGNQEAKDFLASLRQTSA